MVLYLGCSQKFFTFISKNVTDTTYDYVIVDVCEWMSTDHVKP